MLACSFIGGRSKIKAELKDLLELTKADEIIAVFHIYDHETRIRSFKIFSEICAEI
jgi:hypothetical protein